MSHESAGASSANSSVSVVVPVFNGARAIGETLTALLNQTVRCREVIVVDDGSTDATAEIVRGFAVTYLFQRNAGPAAARNTGWRAACGDVVAFTDSDCVPRTNWVEELAKPFAGAEIIGGVGGSYSTANPESTLARLIGLEIAFRHQKMGSVIDAVGTYSAAFRREALERVGGFDEGYRRASGEDWDLSFRLRESGYLLVNQPTAVVAHYHTDTIGKYLREQLTHGKWRMRLYRRHPGKVKGDSYTGAGVKYQVALAGLLSGSWLLALFTPRAAAGTAVALSLLLFSTTAPLAAHAAGRDWAAALLSIPVQFVRSFAWLAGALTGLLPGDTTKSN